MSYFLRRTEVLDEIYLTKENFIEPKLHSSVFIC